MRRQLQAGKNKDHVIIVEINTWQFSQFSMGDKLPILVLKHFIDQLANAGNKSIQRILAPYYKPVVQTLASLTGFWLGGVQGSTTAINTSEVWFSEESDPTRQLSKLRAQMQTLVTKCLDNRFPPDEQNRVVVLIDDLDRLVPERAVELLECFKLFLEVERCVFVLACEFDVIMHGLKARFGSKHHPDQGGETWAFQQVQDAYKQIKGNLGGQPFASERTQQEPARRASQRTQQGLTAGVPSHFGIGTQAKNPNSIRSFNRLKD